MISKRRNHKKHPNSLKRSRSRLNGRSRLDPWELVWGQPYIDCETLAAAIEEDLIRSTKADYRTRLLIHDAAQAIRSYWGAGKFDHWIGTSPVGNRIQSILVETFSEQGFPHIRRKLVASVKSEVVERIFELLGQGIAERVEVHIAGSIPTLIKGLTFRPTQDIDFVNEVPAEIRRQQDVLTRIVESYGLSVGHVQSHYLPANWQDRRHYFGDFGGLRVYMVDEYDVFVSKLSSKQPKHLQDLEVMAPKLDKDKLRQRLFNDGRAFLDTPLLRGQIAENWRFIFREPLPLESLEESQVSTQPRPSAPGSSSQAFIPAPLNKAVGNKKRRKKKK